mmetsp:Transcript_157/g.606  ORF Transcript_157/g.606 Transcript_157/m.606 type:complete len:227 (+) Transcript_157:1757-2437(+)
MRAEAQHHEVPVPRHGAERGGHRAPHVCGPHLRPRAGLRLGHPLDELRALGHRPAAERRHGHSAVAAVRARHLPGGGHEDGGAQHRASRGTGGSARSSRRVEHEVHRPAAPGPAALRRGLRRAALHAEALALQALRGRRHGLPGPPGGHHRALGRRGRAGRLAPRARRLHQQPGVQKILPQVGEGVQLRVSYGALGAEALRRGVGRAGRAVPQEDPRGAGAPENTH